MLHFLVLALLRTIAMKSQILYALAIMTKNDFIRSIVSSNFNQLWKVQKGFRLNNSIKRKLLSFDFIYNSVALSNQSYLTFFQVTPSKMFCLKQAYLNKVPFVWWTQVD